MRLRWHSDSRRLVSVPDRGAQPDGGIARKLEREVEQLRLAKEAEPQSVAHCRVEVFLRKSRTSGVRDCSQWRRDTEAGLIGDVREFEVGLVKNYAISSLAKAGRNCQVDLVGENVAKPVKLKSRVVRNHASRAAPQADQREILMFSGGPFGKTVDTSLDSSPVSAGGVVMLEPCRVAD